MPAQRMRSVIPPYMLRRIIEHGNAPQRDCALHTLNHVQSLLGNKPLRSPTEKNARAGEALRDIYDAQNGTQLPGKQVRKEGQPSNHDVAVDEAYDYLGVTYDFFWQAYRRNSLDNQGLPLVGSVHYGKEYQNAFWNGQQMVFGDGDGEIFNRFTIAIDVVGHELAHGVTESEAGLIYYQQSGALNESLSDVFGSLVKQFHLQQTADKADWLIGAGLLAKGHQRPRATLDVGTRHRLRRSAAGQRPAARQHERLYPDQGRQRRRASQLWYPQPRLLSGGDGAGRIRLGESRLRLV